MMIADFEDDEFDYVRHRILLIENTARESAGSAFSTFKFLKAARRYLIDEGGGCSSWQGTGKRTRYSNELRVENQASHNTYFQ